MQRRIKRRRSGSRRVGGSTAGAPAVGGSTAGAPAVGGSVVAFARVHPILRAVGHFLALPERGLGLEPVHEEGATVECRLAVTGGGDDQHDGLADGHAAIAVNDERVFQIPALARLRLNLLQHALSHARIVLQRHGDHARCLGEVAHIADKAGDAANLRPALNQRFDLRARVEPLCLNLDGHRLILPSPGGKTRLRRRNGAALSDRRIPGQWPREYRSGR